MDLDVSGGTWQTTLDVLATSDPRRPIELPKDHPAGRTVRTAKVKPHFEPEASGWVVPVPSIDPEIVNREEAEMLETLIRAAVNEGVDRVQELIRQKMTELTNGIDIPGITS